MRKGGILGLLGAVACAAAVMTSTASALSPPALHQTFQVAIPKPNGVAYDPFDDVVYVSSVGPPPRLYALDEETGHVLASTDFPADADPGSVAFGTDGYIYVIDHAKDRIFRVCPECGAVTVINTPSSVNFLTGYIDGYQGGPMLLDFGNSVSAGRIWYGLGFLSALGLPDTITPNGGEILNDVAKPHGSWISAVILAADAENNRLFEVSDTLPPRFLGELGPLPGNPGLQPPRDVSISPLNLNPDVSGVAIHPIFVALPDLGIYQSAGPNGPWMQVPATNIGRPTQVGADCETVGASSFGTNTVTFFRQEEPKGTHCEDLVELVLYGGQSSEEIAAGLKAFFDGTAQVRVFGGAPGERGQAYEAKKRKRLRLTAGKITKFKVALPPSIQARLRSHGKVVFRVKIRVTSSAGQTAKVTRRVRSRR